MHAQAEAVARLGERLRREEYANAPTTALAQLALGWEIEPAGLDRTDIDELLEVADDGHVRLPFGVFAAGGVYVALPRQRSPEGEVSYIGPDSLWLLRTAWRLAPGGERMIDLGTGTGFLAAALAPRYHHVVATDVSASVCDGAALTVALNPQARNHVAVVAADLTAGIRSRCADLVTCNPPFMPGHRLHHFADGGPTGFELPRRALLEGSRLLSPGGMSISLCTSLVLRDGRQPLVEVVAALGREGHDVEVLVPSSPIGATSLEDVVRARCPEVEAARLVAVVVRAGP